MKIRETDLPGIGKKFELVTRSGEKLIVIIHDDGRRECFGYGNGSEEEIVSLLTLEDDEARKTAAIIGGMSYTPKALETIEVALDDLIMEWYRVEDGWSCIGLTIGELGIRQTTGASIIGVVQRDGRKFINPGPEVVLQRDSLLIVAGERSQQKQFRQVLANGCE
ncbi:cation:proton antiporter regulatory subunit [Paenibacillus aurantius]|uniref:Cation:proton antiporter regulatory subunit n=1 Tax=Paenibacillus aurantius TaxID=2918900 RepID=A0AA96LDF9_9BACL|nr:cation:proton antiporter regulatory subunit [Paenibacillus aurantius]WNQ10066.1 cation:proton antiporter regulatory subunit [Paenibacillus aurantius]